MTTARPQLRVGYRVHLESGRAGSRMVVEGTSPAPRDDRGPHAPRIARAARLLALAHHYREILEAGEVSSMAEIARLSRVTRARITQVMDLLHLAPDIQEELLGADRAGVGPAPSVRVLLSIAGEVAWERQRARWAEVRGCEAAVGGEE